MSRKCEHDWFDHYMMYNMMSNGGGKGSGEAFCLLIAGGLGLYVLANVLCALFDRGKFMAENKFVVKTVFHDENRDTLLREDYRETREKAQELKDLADLGYAGLFGKGQTKGTTEIIER